MFTAFIDFYVKMYQHTPQSEQCFQKRFIFKLLVRLLFILAIISQIYNKSALHFKFQGIKQEIK